MVGWSRRSSERQAREAELSKREALVIKVIRAQFESLSPSEKKRAQRMMAEWAQKYETRPRDYVVASVLLVSMLFLFVKLGSL